MATFWPSQATSGARVSVGTAATRLDTAVTDNRVGKISLIINNTGASAIDLGGSTVATGAGFPLAAGATISMDINPGAGGIYGVTSTGTVSVAVLQVGS